MSEPKQLATTVPATNDSALLRELVLILARQHAQPQDGLGVTVFQTLMQSLKTIEEKVVTPQVIHIEPAQPQVIHVTPQLHDETAQALQELTRVLQKDNRANAQTITALQRVAGATQHASDNELRAIKDLAQSILRQGEQPITVNVSPTPITVQPAPVKVVVSFPRKMREVFDILRNARGQTDQIIKTSETTQE